MRSSTTEFLFETSELRSRNLSGVRSHDAMDGSLKCRSDKSAECGWSGLQLDFDEDSEP